MISVTAAKKIIAANPLVLSAETRPLSEVLQRRLAADVFSPVDVPAFIQSSMDGYAFSYASWKEKKALIIKGEMQAGAKTGFALAPGHAARIFTGAPLPDGADTVIMQEQVTIHNNTLTITDENLQAGNSVRLAGSAIKAGMLAVPKDTLLSPGAIGFLAGMGINRVPVWSMPAVGVIVTGKELQQPGAPLSFGEVYESNSFALKAALQKIQIDAVKTYTVEDDLELVKQVLTQALSENDLVLLTGGVSVGDYDFVVQAAAACGVEQLFHKIKQRPGKPLFFGKKENKLVFGLPGNPSSVLTCFYEYVLPALKIQLPTMHAPLANSFKKTAGLTHFLKACWDGEKVLPLDAQESYRMRSFAVANCLIIVGEETTFCEAGSLAEIHLLSF
ncbi:MAG: molybdopterin molybdotransferase MoeA [Chitinophagaceae bacterium]